MNNTIITPGDKEALDRVVKTYLADEKQSAMADIRDEDITDDFDELTDKQFYDRYEAHYGHIWFDLFRLSQLQ